MSIEDEESFHLFPTGIFALDQHLGGDMYDVNGIPDSSLILIQAEPSSDIGTLFATKVFINLLRNNAESDGYYLHSSKPQHMLKREFKAYNWKIDDLVQEGRWNFIDMWNITTTLAASSSKIGQIDIRRKTYLKHAYERMLQLKKTSNRYCFSVVDNLLFLKEENLDLRASKIQDFFKEILDLIFQLGGVHFFILPKGILSDIAERLIMSAATGLIDFKFEMQGTKKQNLFHIAKMNGIAFQSEMMEITPALDGGFRIESTGKI